MSLEEEFAHRFAGLRHGYSVFTPTKETREDGKAKGKYVTISQTLNQKELIAIWACLLYTSPSPRDGLLSRMPSSA